MRTASVLAGILILAAIGLAHADVAPTTQNGETIFCAPGTDVEMRAERVAVTLFPSHAEVDATFIMFNPGEEVTMKVGFPAEPPSGELKKGEKDMNGGVRDFCVYSNGELRRANTPVAPVHHWGDFLAWDQEFRAKSETKLRVTYWGSTHAGYSKVKRRAFPAERIKEFSYILLSGALWKGRIGKATIVFDLSKLESPLVYEISPFGFEYKDGKIVWRLTDFEPTQYFIPRLTIKYLDRMPRNDGEERPEPISLRDAARANWKADITLIEGIMRDKGLSPGERLDRISKVKFIGDGYGEAIDWRVRLRAYEAARELGKEIAADEKFEGPLSIYACSLLGLAQCTECISLLLKQAFAASDSGVRRDALHCLRRFYSPKVAGPLLERLLQENKEDDVVLDALANALTEQCEHAIVPVLQAIGSGKAPKGRKSVLVRIAREMAVASPPLPGGHPWVSLIDIRPIEEKDLPGHILSLAEFAGGHRWSSFPRPGAGGPDSPWPKIAQSLYRMIGFSTYADCLDEATAKKSVRKERKVLRVKGFSRIEKTYLNDKLMEAVIYERNGRIGYHGLRNDERTVVTCQGSRSKVSRDLDW